MLIHLRNIFIALFIIFSTNVSAQTDSNPPIPPVLNLLNVDPLTGNVEISWFLSPSHDVAGYVVYLYKNNEGYALDTLHNPLATSYLRTGSGSSYYSESFVVAAIDSAGNISPLSNQLGTIHTEIRLDSCNKSIEVLWNTYLSIPNQVQSYSVFFSEGGSSFIEAAQVAAEKNNLLMNDFTINTEYCFIVRANLAGGYLSGSNKACILTEMQQLPQWINADYATVREDNSILLSFTMDPSSEIRTLHIERKTGLNGTFQLIDQITSLEGPFAYTDSKADISKVNYYMASALNNCKIPVTYSNVASNIVLSMRTENNEISLAWNPYKEWNGNVAAYEVYVNTGTGWQERSTGNFTDTLFNIHYSDLMYEVTGDKVCFMIRAKEGSNPYGITGESSSSTVCMPVTELITVPNTFTPDQNGINDLFYPFLSFTPSDYQLIISDTKRKILYETRDYTDKWDGTQNGNPLPEGVYLWFLKVKTPSGKNISRTGTVTIIYNR
jgi:gliding motility-associated-like protein